MHTSAAAAAAGDSGPIPSAGIAQPPTHAPKAWAGQAPLTLPPHVQDTQQQRQQQPQRITITQSNIKVRQRGAAAKPLDHPHGLFIEQGLSCAPTRRSATYLLQSLERHHRLGSLALLDALHKRAPLCSASFTNVATTSLALYLELEFSRCMCACLLLRLPRDAPMPFLPSSSEPLCPAGCGLFWVKRQRNQMHSPSYVKRVGGWKQYRLGC